MSNSVGPKKMSNSGFFGGLLSAGFTFESLSQFIIFFTDDLSVHVHANPLTCRNYCLHQLINVFLPISLKMPSTHQGLQLSLSLSFFLFLFQFVSACTKMKMTGEFHCQPNNSKRAPIEENRNSDTSLKPPTSNHNGNGGTSLNIVVL